MKPLFTLIFIVLTTISKSQILIFKYEHNIRYSAPVGSKWNDMINSGKYQQIDIDTILRVCIVQLDMMMVFFIGVEFEITEVIEKNKYLHLKLLSNRTRDEYDFKILQSVDGEIFGVLSRETSDGQFGYYLHPASFIQDTSRFNEN